MSFPVENGHVAPFWPLPPQPVPGRFEEASRLEQSKVRDWRQRMQWCSPGVSYSHGGAPKAGWLIGKIPAVNGWWLGVALVQETITLTSRFPPTAHEPVLGLQWAGMNRNGYSYGRRKFRSQTSDNMDKWKSKGGKSQRGEAKKWEEQRRERERRKKMQVREKVGKSRVTAFFQWFVALEGRKVGSLKRRARSHVVRWDEGWKIARCCGAKHISKSKN